MVRHNSKHLNIWSKCFDNLFFLNGAAPVYFWLLAFAKKKIWLKRKFWFCREIVNTASLHSKHLCCQHKWKYTQIQKEPYKNVLSTNRRGVHYISCKSKQCFCIPSSCSAQWNANLQKYKNFHFQMPTLDFCISSPKSSHQPKH